ncbi:MAG: signal peptidase II [Verrucomicrobia bacterium]|nr:signal peptidase II [Verrucomicrobiota bacterium]
MRLKASWLFTLFLIFLALLGIDMTIKVWVQKTILEPRLVLHTDLGLDFFLQVATNRGGAFGLLSNFQFELLWVRIAILIGILAYLLRGSPTKQGSLCLALIFTGAFGNVLDNFLYGHVIDMFHFLFWGRSYGIFNFADALIFLGCFGMILDGIRKPALAK